MAKTILLVDDDLNVVKLFSLTAETSDADFNVLSAGGGHEAVEAIARSKPDLLILDIRMAKGDGFHVLDHMKKEGIDVPVIILTNYKQPEYIERSKTYSAVKNYVIKHEVRMDRVFDMVNGCLA